MLSLRSLLLIGLLASGTAGCATMPLVQKHAFDFKTTALFMTPCAAARAAGDVPRAQGEDCEGTHLARMVERFMSIVELDEKNGIPGDTIAGVRAKGFTIYMDADEKIRRPNTRAVYANEALAIVGMGVSPPPLQRPEEIRAYTEFMGQHYGEEYVEKDMKHASDRFCINARDNHDIGDDRVFAIVWREGHVFKRVIKGGPINNAKTERSFLLCPGDFVVETLTGGVTRTVNTFYP
ncbi:MAG: hypothetical protein ACREJG_13030 [Candidatus Rokuibacteriota bacterium]